RKTLALGLDGDALDRSRYAGSSQRLPTTEGSQATPSVTCRPGSTPDKKLNPRRACSPSQRSLTSISVATASQCSTNSGTSRNGIESTQRARPAGDLSRRSPVG